MIIPFIYPCTPNNSIGPFVIVGTPRDGFEMRSRIVWYCNQCLQDNHTELRGRCSEQPATDTILGDDPVRQMRLTYCSLQPPKCGARYTPCKRKDPISIIVVGKPTGRSKKIKIWRVVAAKDYRMTT